MKILFFLLFFGSFNINAQSYDCYIIGLGSDVRNLQDKVVQNENFDLTDNQKMKIVDYYTYSYYYSVIDQMNNLILNSYKEREELSSFQLGRTTEEKAKQLRLKDDEIYSLKSNYEQKKHQFEEYSKNLRTKYYKEYKDKFDCGD